MQHANVIEWPRPQRCTQGMGPDAEPLFMPLAQLIERTGTEVEWQWDGIIGCGLITLVAAEPKAGKSTLMAHLLKAIVQGVPFLGRDTQAPNGVWIVSEEALPLSLRLAELSLPEISAEAGVAINANARFADWDQIIGALGELPSGALIILDTGSRFWDVEDENSAAEVQKALWPLMQLAQDNLMTIVFVHHLGKGTLESGRNTVPNLRRVRGSSALVGSVDIIACVTKVGRSNQRRISVEGRFGMSDTIGELADGRYRLVGVEDLDLVDVPNAGLSSEPPRGRRRKAMAFLREVLAAGPARANEIKELAERVGIAEPTLQRAKKALGIESVKLPDHWEWQLPKPQDDQAAQDDQDAI